jgi:hypothetical protein
MISAARQSPPLLGIRQPTLFASAVDFMAFLMVVIFLWQIDLAYAGKPEATAEVVAL